MEYTVSLSRYEGPYTKLLDLIESRKLSITEINLASLADDYVSYTKSLEKKDHLDMSLFLVIASTLMLMKVKSLLPYVEYTGDEEKQVYDLKKKLVILSTLKKIVHAMQRKQYKDYFYSPQKIRLKKKNSAPPKNLTKEALLNSVLSLIDTGEKRSFIKEVSVKRPLPMETVHLFLRERTTQKTSLRSLATEIQDDKALIVVFLSLLELIRHNEFIILEETGTDIIFTNQNMLQSSYE